jgi:hypothetical protein
MADLAQFQATANSIYDPMATADKASLTTNYNSGKAAMELGRGDANVNYDKALRGVNESEKTQTDSLNSLYSSRLGGNFSGLQGNALQGLYGKDNQARADIQTARASKLAQITGQEKASLDKYNTDTKNVDTRYTGEKAKYANEGYNSALKQEEVQRKDAERQQQEAQRQANSDRQFALSESRFSASEARANSKASADAGKGYKTSQLSSGNYKFTGPHGGPVSMSEYSDATGNNIMDLLRNSGSAYDQAAFKDATYWLGKGGADLADKNLRIKYGKLY